MIFKLENSLSRFMRDRDTESKNISHTYVEFSLSLQTLIVLLSRLPEDTGSWNNKKESNRVNDHQKMDSIITNDHQLQPGS